VKRSLLAQEDRFPAYGSRPIFLYLPAYGACPMAPCVHEDQTTANAADFAPTRRTKRARYN